MADRSTVRCSEVCPVHKFVNSVFSVNAFQNMNNRFVAEKDAAFCVSHFAGVKEYQCIDLASR